MIISYVYIYVFLGLVMKSLTLKSSDEELSEVRSRLEQLTPEIKTLAITFKKTSISSQD